jgi:hypothetical protein
MIRLNLIQITFHNQAEAEAGGTFDVEDYSLNVSSGSVQVGTSDGLLHLILKVVILFLFQVKKLQLIM